jgi:hypothetical protein
LVAIGGLGPGDASRIEAGADRVLRNPLVREVLDFAWVTIGDDVRLIV